MVMSADLVVSMVTSENLVVSTVTSEGLVVSMVTVLTTELGSGGQGEGSG